MTRIINPRTCRRGLLPVPLPVTLVSYVDDNQTGANITAVSYVSQVASGVISVSLRHSRHAHEVITAKRRFGVNYMNVDYVPEADHCGIFSGRRRDKFKETSLTRVFGPNGIPLVDEAPLSLECKTIEAMRIGTHTMFIAKVLSIVQNERYVKWLMHRNFEYFPADSGKSIGLIFKEGRYLVAKDD